MTLPESIFRGKVDWSGENHGMLLKTSPDGPFTAMALFFRILYSPCGPGTVLLLMANPASSAGMPEDCNVVVSDNQALGKYLIREFVAKLEAFASVPAFANLTYLEGCTIPPGSGECPGSVREILHASEHRIELVWKDLGSPVALELPPEHTGPKDRKLYTVLVEARNVEIMVNGRRLPGELAERVQAGIKTTTGFLYFAETWIEPVLDPEAAEADGGEPV